MTPADAPLRTVVVVPARDEEARIGACVAALAGQRDITPGSWEVVLVLDACTDATAAVARAAAGRLPLRLVPGPGRGVGPARGTGMAAAAARLRAAAPGLGRRVIASTDADSRVEPDWLARIFAAIDEGAEAVGGRITLDDREAAALPGGVLAARAEEAAARLAAVRSHTPAAEHHQFSGASLALTLEAYDRVGGLPAVAALEDEALERALRTAGIPIAYRTDVRAVTSARTASHVPRGLAQVLRAASWQATRAAPAQALGVAERPRRAERVPPVSAPLPLAAATARADHLVLRLGDGRRGAALRRALVEAPDATEVVVVVADDVGVDGGQVLAERLAGDPALQLVRGAQAGSDPLAEWVVRPALNLWAPDLAVVRSPLTRSWAIRRTALTGLRLPAGDAVDLTVLLDVWTEHGPASVAELPVAGSASPARADPALTAYELLVALTARLGTSPTVASSAFTDADGTRRAHLDEQPPLRP